MIMSGNPRAITVSRNRHHLFDSLGQTKDRIPLWIFSYWYIASTGYLKKSLDDDGGIRRWIPQGLMKY